MVHYPARVKFHVSTVLHKKNVTKNKQNKERHPNNNVIVGAIVKVPHARLQAQDRYPFFTLTEAQLCFFSLTTSFLLPFSFLFLNSFYFHSCIPTLNTIIYLNCKSIFTSISFSRSHQNIYLNMLWILFFRFYLVNIFFS